MTPDNLIPSLVLIAASAMLARSSYRFTGQPNFADIEIVGQIERNIAAPWSCVSHNVRLSKSIFAILIFIGLILAFRGCVLAYSTGNLIIVSAALMPLVIAWYYCRGPGWFVLGSRGFAWRSFSYQWGDVVWFNLAHGTLLQIGVDRKNGTERNAKIIAIESIALVNDDLDLLIESLSAQCAGRIRSHG